MHLSLVNNEIKPIYCLKPFKTPSYVHLYNNSLPSRKETPKSKSRKFLETNKKVWK